MVVVSEYITIKDILAACHGRADQNGGGMCRCPVHDDRAPSLSVSEGNRGQPIVLKCFRGCDFEDIRAELERIIERSWPPKDQAPAKRSRAARYRGNAAAACAEKVFARLEELGTQKQLKGTLGEEYLIGRGIGSYASSKAFRYVPDGPSL